VTLQTEINVQTRGQGLVRIDDAIEKALGSLLKGNEAGLVHLHILHTSASLLIQENSDPTAKADLEEFFNRLAPEGQNWHRHTVEGPDDTVSHLKASLLPVSLTLPLTSGRLKLGTWQGVYLFEHRHAPHSRKIFVTAMF